MPKALPLIVLAGSDARRPSVPAGLREMDMLTGYKGAVRLADGTPLAAAVVERFLASGRFRDPVLIGPERIYGSLGLDCPVENSEGGLARTLEVAVKAVMQRFDASTPVAFTACDILPTAEELQSLMADAYDPAGGSVFWTQLVEASAQEMGASHWKPGYAFVAPPRGLVNLYPGHLVVARPATLRFRVLVRLLHLAYRFRNRALWQRAVGMLPPGIGALAAEDLRNLLHGNPTLLSLTAPYRFLSGYLRYRAQAFSIGALEDVVATTFVKAEAVRGASERPVVFSLTRIRSLAKDIDTRAELREVLGPTP